MQLARQIAGSEERLDEILGPVGRAGIAEIQESILSTNAPRQRRRFAISFFTIMLRQSRLPFVTLEFSALEASGDRRDDSVLLCLAFGAACVEADAKSRSPMPSARISFNLPGRPLA